MTKKLRERQRVALDEHSIFDLCVDALLKDLEATIPPPVTCGPKPTIGTGPKEEEVLAIHTEVNGNEVENLFI